jgi:hypothetical protein
MKISDIQKTLDFIKNDGVHSRQENSIGSLFVELRENYDCAIIIYLTTAQNLYSEIPPAGTKHFSISLEIQAVFLRRKVLA